MADHQAHDSAQDEEFDDEIDDGCWHPLHEAANDADVCKLRALLASNRYPVDTVWNQLTPLQYTVNANVDPDVDAHGAKEEDIVECIRLLASHGANLNQQDVVGRTLLHDCANNNRLAAARMLIELGANVNADLTRQQDEYGHEGGCGCGNHNALQSLLSSLTGGTFESRANRATVTPLHYAAERGNIELAKLLLENGANVVAWDKVAGTPLKYAAARGHMEVCKLLLDVEGGKEALGVRDRDGYLPLHALTMSRDCNPEIVKLLLENGADVNAPVDGERSFHTGMTALALACDEKANEATIKLLLEHGADPNTVAATEYRLSGRSFKLTPFLLAVFSDSFSVTKLLLDHGANVKALIDSGPSPLDIAVIKSNTAICKLLVDAGCDVNAPSLDGFTALHTAACFCNKETVRALVDLGADVFARVKDGRTPLHMACFKGQLDNVRELVEAGCDDLEIEDEMAWTPLHFAAWYGHLDVVKFLLDKGAEVGKRTTGGPSGEGAGCTPAMLARLTESEDVEKALVEAGDSVPEKQQKEEWVDEKEDWEDEDGRLCDTRSPKRPKLEDAETEEVTKKMEDLDTLKEGEDDSL